MKRLLHILSIALILGLNPSISAMESGMSDSTSSPEVTRDMNVADSQYASDSESDDEKGSLSDHDEKIEDGKEEESDSSDSSSSSSSYDSDSDDVPLSLLEQSLEKVMQQIDQTPDVNKAYAVLKCLPQELISKVLYRFIFKGHDKFKKESLLWTYKKKHALVQKLRLSCTGTVYKHELVLIQDALAECEKIDALDGATWQKLQTLDIADTELNEPDGTVKIQLIDDKKEPSLYCFIANSQGEEQVIPLFPLKKLVSFQKIGELKKSLLSFGADLPSQISISHVLPPISVNVPGLNLGTMSKEEALSSLKLVMPAMLFMMERFAARRVMGKFTPCTSISELAYQLCTLPEEKCMRVLMHIIIDSPLTKLQITQLAYWITKIFSKCECNHFYGINETFENLLKQVKEDATKLAVNYVENRNLRRIPLLSEIEIDAEFTEAARDDQKKALALMALLPGCFNCDYITPTNSLINSVILKSGMKLEDLLDVKKDPFMKAIVMGNNDLVKKLLDHGANPREVFYWNKGDERPNSRYWEIQVNPLVLAIVGQHADIVQTLIDAGVDVNMPCHETGKLPLEYAYETGNQEILDMLFYAVNKEKAFEYMRENSNKLDMQRYEQKLCKNKMLQQIPTTERYKSIIKHVQKYIPAQHRDLVLKLKHAIKRLQGYSYGNRDIDPGIMAELLKLYLAIPQLKQSQKIKCAIKEIEQARPEHEKLAQEIMNDGKQEVAEMVKASRTKQYAQQVAQAVAPFMHKNRIKRVHKQLQQEVDTDSAANYFAKTKSDFSQKTKKKIEEIEKRQQEKEAQSQQIKKTISNNNSE